MANPYAAYPSPLEPVDKAVSSLGQLFLQIPKYAALDANTAKDQAEAQVLGTQNTALQKTADVFRAAMANPQALSAAMPDVMANIAQASKGAGFHNIGDVMRAFVANTPGTTDAQKLNASIGAGNMITDKNAFSQGGQDQIATRDNNLATARGIAEAWSKPMNVGAGSTVVDPRSGKTVATGLPTESTVKGGILSRLPGGQQNAVVMSGVKPKNYVAADGSKGSTLDGVTDANTGEPLVKGTIIAKEEDLGGGADGKAPVGFRWSADGKSLEAIPGGPADMKAQAQFSQDSGAIQSVVSDLDKLAATANELKNHPGLGMITGMAGSIPNRPGSDATAAQALLDTLKSKVGFTTLQNMRNASKSGGAIGQVSDKEEIMLQNNMTPLEKKQSEADLKKSLDGIIKYTEEAKTRLKSAYDLKWSARNGASNGAARGPTPADAAEAQQAIAAGAPAATVSARYKQKFGVDLPQGGQ